MSTLLQSPTLLVLLARLSNPRNCSVDSRPRPSPSAFRVCCCFSCCYCCCCVVALVWARNLISSAFCPPPTATHNPPPLPRLTPKKNIASLRPTLLALLIFSLATCPAASAPAQRPVRILSVTPLFPLSLSLSLLSLLSLSLHPRCSLPAHLKLMVCEKMWTDCYVIEFLGNRFEVAFCGCCDLAASPMSLPQPTLPPATPPASTTSPLTVPACAFCFLCCLCRRICYIYLSLDLILFCLPPAPCSLPPSRFFVCVGSTFSPYFPLYS